MFLFLKAKNPLNKIVSENKNDINPKDWNKKSEIILPFLPIKLLTFEISLNIRLGSSGEYETSEINKYKDKTTKSMPNSSNNLLITKSKDLFK